ncbi:2-oxoacid:acceptor oxidoreductase subunit alpha [Veillonella sp.]|uniref:2-oxoacid:acceptor oxidoreductase subunit alpha n=1 Tax=Veillonella sp. TaxID=1926307 RepID=UPI002580B5EC|nr:2-oxoacid:acceptor oxidoreductase subunit alpha [Veillonella sp.]MBS6228067.1 2-oxoacid:acceptor oxidoreductase subunit alpha [Veillonella sp.]
MQKRKDFIWKMGGQQGEGIESCGEIMATILAKEGYSLYSQRLFASRIKGGHTTFALRVALEQVMSIGEGVDFLLALDQETVDMHGVEVRDGGYIICDSKVKPDFSKFEGSKVNCLSLPISETAMKQGSLLMRNIVALGMSVALLGFDTKMFKDAIAAKFAKKSQEIVDKNLAAFDDGHSLVMEKLGDVEIDTLPAPGKKDQMFLLGNEACALGAIAAGSRFMASYPITPASEVMEYMIKNMDKLGATIVQTEDEIAACMTAMGGVYAGVRGFTCTSGPGLSLMAESLSMASMAELPMVVIDVQRSGPSTGMATKVEQSDIDAACYNAHGDYAGIVISPTSIEECFYEIQKAFNLAEMYQCPVIFMPDLQQGLNKQSVPTFDLNRVPINRGKMMKEAEGKPAEAPTMHVAQTDKRFRKLETVADNYEPFLNNAKYDEADVLVVGMASSRGAIEEAVAEFDQEGVKVNHLQLRLIKPFPAKQLQPFMDAAKKVFIVEHNATGQLTNLFKINMHKKSKISSCLKYDGNPFTKSYVKNAIKEVL